MPTLKLTKSVIDDLRPGATGQLYWDQTLRGFGLTVTPAAARQAGRSRPTGLRLEEVIAQHRTDYLEPREVGGETLRIMKRILLAEWKGRQITDISRSDVRDCIEAIMQRGAIAMAARAFGVHVAV